MSLLVIVENQNTINVVRYFLEKYKLRLQYPFLPCITTQDGSYFPPEVCYLEPVIIRLFIRPFSSSNNDRYLFIFC